jgi:uncharacterized protein
MRTTLDIDDDALLAVKERARREGKTAGALVSELTRRAPTEVAPYPSTAERSARDAQEPAAFFGVRPLAPVPGLIISNEHVLIALADGGHQHHRRAREWLERNIDAGWASCPITLARAAAHAAHESWPDDLSVTRAETFARTRIHGPRQRTDVYLLAMAAAKGGRFVSFDGVIATNAAPAAMPANLVVL